MKRRGRGRGEDVDLQRLDPLRIELDPPHFSPRHRQDRARGVDPRRAAHVHDPAHVVGGTDHDLFAARSGDALARGGVGRLLPRVQIAAVSRRGEDAIGRAIEELDEPGLEPERGERLLILEDRDLRAVVPQDEPAAAPGRERLEPGAVPEQHGGFGAHRDLADALDAGAAEDEDEPRGPQWRRR